MESKSQQYINEMEKNAKLFEEKLNKFKKYQTSEAYTQQDDFEEIEDKNIRSNKRPSKQRPMIQENQEQSENSEEDYYSKASKNKEKNSIPSSKKVYKKENSAKYSHSNYKQKEQKDLSYKDNEDDYEEYEYNPKRKNFNNFKNKEQKTKDQSNEDLIEEMRADLIEKSNLIKKLDKDLKAKEKLPSKMEFDRLNSNHEKVSNELEEKIKYIKQQEEEMFSRT